MITTINEFRNINENEEKSFINYEKLLKLAESIKIICNGEYGDLYWDKLNSIFICLGDSHPFDTDSLKYYILDNICDKYENQDKINIEIDHECYPGGDKTQFKYNKNKFHEFK